MRLENGLLVMDVPMGTTAYAGRAVHQGELIYLPDQQAWVQLLPQPPAPEPELTKVAEVAPSSRQHVRKWVALIGGAATLAAIAAAVVMLWPRPQPEAPARAAALPVAQYQAGTPEAVEDVGEPYRPAAPAGLPPPIQAGPIEDAVQAVQAEGQPLPELKTMAAPPPRAAAPAKSAKPATKTSPPPQAKQAAAPQPGAPLPTQVAALPVLPVPAMAVQPPPVAPRAQQAKAAPEPAESGVILNREATQPAPARVVVNPTMVAPTTHSTATPPVAKPSAAPTPAPVASQRANAGPRVRLVTVMDAQTIVISDPTTRIPVPVKVGQPLHDGSTLQSVDVEAGTARTSKGTLRLE